MNTNKREKQDVGAQKKNEGVTLKLRTLTVRSGVTAGRARAGCGTCHKPTNHNETLVAR